MKHILSFIFLFFTAIQLQSQEIECAEQIAYEQDVITNESISSDRFSLNLLPEKELPEPPFTLVVEDFALSDLMNINRVCFPGTFIFGDVLRSENTSYRTDICEPYTKTFEVIYYEDYPMVPVDLDNHIFAGPFEVATEAEHIPGTPYYQFTGSHDVVSFELNTKYWISIQNIDDDECDFQLLYNEIEDLRTDRGQVNTREVSDDFFHLRPDDIDRRTGFINFALGATDLPPIPTLSQWGIIVLGFMVTIFGVVYIRKEKLGIA